MNLMRVRNKSFIGFKAESTTRIPHSDLPCTGKTIEALACLLYKLYVSLPVKD